jgi:hypothetical protein
VRGPQREPAGHKDDDRDEDDDDDDHGAQARSGPAVGPSHERVTDAQRSEPEDDNREARRRIPPKERSRRAPNASPGWSPAAAQASSSSRSLMRWLTTRLDPPGGMDTP